MRRGYELPAACLLAAACGLTGHAARAQSGEPEAVSELVISRRLSQGSVITEVPAEVSLDSRAVQALGVGSLGEVLEEIAVQARGGDAEREPIVLVDGRPVSSLSEVEDLPPEVVRTVQVFPEAVALQYGYPGDRRVVNFILRPDYRALTLLARLPLPNGQGQDTYRARANLVRIDANGRWSADAEYRREDAVLEAPLGGGAIGRTLTPRSERVTLNSVLSRTLPDATATLNGRLQLDRSEGRYSRLVDTGLENAFDRFTERQGLHAGGTLNGDGSAWRWSVTGGLDAGEERIRSGAGSAPPPVAPPSVRWLGADRRAITRQAAAELLLTRQVPALSSGPASLSLRTSASSRGREERFLSPGGERRTQGRVGVFANIETPLVDRAGPGRLTLSLNGGLEAVSDFEALSATGGALRWTPREGAVLTASANRQEVAPDPNQLMSGALPVFNVRVYDFRANQGREVIRYDGGAPALSVETRDVANLRFQFKPLRAADLTLAADYSWRRIRDAISGPLGVSPQIEASYPGRFARDAAGKLVGFDARPVNFAQTERRQFRWGLNLYRISADRRASATRVDDAEDDDLAGSDVDDPLITPPPTPRSAHLRLALYHTWRLQDEVTPWVGGPVIDLLDGGAIGSRGGEPRHQVEVQFGGEYRAVSGRLAAVWREDTDVRGRNALDAPTRLAFSESTRLDARLIVDLAALPLHQRFPWVRGKLNISVENLLGAQSKATDLTGATPLGYSRRQLNPEGRSLRITLRKRFRTS